MLKLHLIDSVDFLKPEKGTVKMFVYTFSNQGNFEAIPDISRNLDPAHKILN